MILKNNQEIYRNLSESYKINRMQFSYNNMQIKEDEIVKKPINEQNDEDKKSEQPKNINEIMQNILFSERIDLIDPNKSGNSKNNK